MELPLVRVFSSPSSRTGWDRGSANGKWVILEWFTLPETNIAKGN